MGIKNWWSRSIQIYKGKEGYVRGGDKRGAESRRKESVTRWHHEPKWITHNKNMRATLLAKERGSEKRGAGLYEKRGTNSQTPRAKKVLSRH